MSDAKKLAIKEFKRNKELQWVHVVLMQTFSKIDLATNYKKAMHAKKVTSISRDECVEELGEVKMPTIEEDLNAEGPSAEKVPHFVRDDK